MKADVTHSPPRLLRLAASRGVVNPAVVRDLRARQLAAEFTYDAFYARGMAAHPAFPDDCAGFFGELRRLALSGELYTLPLETIYTHLIAVVMTWSDERELFDGCRPMSRAAALKGGKYRMTAGSVEMQSYRGVYNLFVHAHIVCPEFPVYAFGCVEAVVRAKDRYRQWQTLRIDEVTPALVAEVVAYWRAQAPWRAAELALFEGPPLTPTQAAAEAERRRREREETLRRIVDGGDFPLKRKSPPPKPRPNPQAPTPKP